MNDVTPQLIAEIATRLFNELPGANQVPKSESQASPEVVGLPSPDGELAQSAGRSARHGLQSSRRTCPA